MITIEDLRTKKPVVYVVSDSLGETAELVARAAASQFNSGHTLIRKIPYVNDKLAIDAVMLDASKNNSLIIFTLLSEDLTDYLLQKANEHNIEAIDVLGPILKGLGKIVESKPRMEPGIIHQTNEEYFRRIEAMEFAVKFDDGKDPRGLHKADIVILGVSRTSKTPISMYLANKGYKVANVPLVPEVPVTEEIYDISKYKMVGLTINPEELFSIRQTRLKLLGLPNKADYANLERILMELDYAESIMRRLRCPIINVTNKAIEETANEIIECIIEGGEAANG